MTCLAESNTFVSGVVTEFFYSLKLMSSLSKWVSQRAAADYLGVSERTLLRWRKAGLLQAGDHFVRKFPAPNSPLVYSLERCEQHRNQFFARQPLETAK